MREREPWRTLHALAKSRATAKGIPFTISAEDVRAAWPADGKCPVLGIELRRGIGGKPIDESPTLDRLNSAWGYEVGNIAVISFKANSAKRALTGGELRQIADWMQAQGLA